jgi:arylsulfatase A-like enzyme
MRNAALAQLLALCASAALAAARAPNIIWLQGDSMDGRLFDPTDPDLGSKLFLEGFDAWTAQGVTFARHFTNSPQCVPSRTSMMTGLHVHAALTPNNGQGLAFSTKTGALDSNCVKVWSRAWCRALAARQAAAGVNATILDQAAAQGYELALFGRVDAGAGIMDDYPGTTGDGWHDGPELGILARGAAIWGAVDREPWARTDEADPAPYADDVRKQGEVLDWIARRGAAGGAAGGAPPFFLWLGMMCPHPPYDTNATWLSHVNGSGAFDVPAQLPRAATHPYDAYMSNAKAMWGEEYSAAQVRDMRHAYWGAVAEAAILMREVVLHASKAGLLNNTVVIITSDHGEMGIEHRMDLKSSLREPSARVPLIMIPFGVPGLDAPGGRVVTNLTSHLDIFPTLAELGGSPPPPPRLKGRSLVPFLRAAPPAAPRADAVAAQYHSNYAPCGSYSLRTSQWKLIAFGHVNGTQLPSQLFDVAGDPREMVDVAPARPDVVQALTAALEGELGAPLAAIEGAMLADNAANYRAAWFEMCTGEELVRALVGSFAGATAADVEARVAAWAGVSPLNATGGGGACGVVP